MLCSAEVCHASVVFGVGKDYYMTETVESTSPQWDQEARMCVGTTALYYYAAMFMFIF